METANEILPYLKLKLQLEHPDLEDCWSEGYVAAQEENDLNDNPYNTASVEADFWENGWWAGFYEEPAWSGSVVDISMKDEGTIVKIKSVTAANESNWSSSDRIRRWTSNVVKVASVVAVTVAALELLDLAS